MTRLNLDELIGAVENGPPVAAADVLGARLKDAFGASEVSFLIADFSGRADPARPRRSGARTQGPETAETVPCGDATGRALATQTVGIESGRLAYTRRSATAGRRSACSTSRPRGPDEQPSPDVALAAHALAYVVIANRRYTDLFAWGQRSVPLSLAAEIQHRLLPGSYTCEAGQFTLAAWLEPAGNVGGDTFDFALERETLHLSMTDAMGHEVDAAVLATVLVGALRNARRAGVGLAEQARLANDRLGEFARERRLRHRAGRPHGPPRADRNDRQRRASPAAAPARGRVEQSSRPTRRSASSGATEYRVQTLPLEPGDR